MINESKTLAVFTKVAGVIEAIANTQQAHAVLGDVNNILVAIAAEAADDRLVKARAIGAVLVLIF